MTTIHHKIEQRNPQDPDTPKRWYASLRKISPISEKGTAQILAGPTPFNLEETKITLTPFKQTVKPLKTIVK